MNNDGPERSFRECFLDRVDPCADWTCPDCGATVAAGDVCECKTCPRCGENDPDWAPFGPGEICGECRDEVDSLKQQGEIPD